MEDEANVAGGGGLNAGRGELGTRHARGHPVQRRRATGDEHGAIGEHQGGLEALAAIATRVGDDGAIRAARDAAIQWGRLRATIRPRVMGARIRALLAGSPGVRFVARVGRGVVATRHCEEQQGNDGPEADTHDGDLHFANAPS
jgi:hypothetical protein